ncbi:ATP-binding cassette domain-containing protein, partial [Leucobacter sp. M11]|uniref:ATP-binding cassette domain-containing protein n=1 Tax=Leucobacter sp. M11 TaxID=2993565 RepID=UPI003FA59364
RGRRRGSMLITQEVQRQLFADTVRGELDLAARGSPDAPGVANLFAQLDLEHLAERHPLSLSGGQQQRLAIAVARLSDRPVVVLDEPSTGVDARHLDTISRLISGLATAGRTVIVITHDRHLRTMTADVEITLRGTSARPIAESSWKRRGDRSESDGGAR